MGKSSVNIHFHGTGTLPTCQSDEVIKTIVNSGETFQYYINFPENEPSGLYWYHPHIHGITEHTVQGGASGAIIVDGIENIQLAVSGLRGPSKTGRSKTTSFTSTSFTFWSNPRITSSSMDTRRRPQSSASTWI